MAARYNPSGIEECVNIMDLILLALPSTVHTHGGGIDGMDYAVGFYEKVSPIVMPDGTTRECVTLNRIQKIAYEQPSPANYPCEDIEYFEILRRFKPKPNSKDGIDLVLLGTMGEGEWDKRPTPPAYRP